MTRKNDHIYATIHSTNLYVSHGTGGVLSLTTTASTGAGLFTVPVHAYSAKELNEIVSDGFGLQICYQDKDNHVIGYPSISGNPFTGMLTAVNTGTDGVLAADTSVYLYNEDGKQIVLTKKEWGSIGGGTTQTGYTFAVVTAKEKQVLEDDDKLYADKFKITSPSLAGKEPLEVLAIASNSDNKELVVTSIEDVNRLTVAANDKPCLAEYTKADSEANAPQNTWIRFGVSDQIDYAIFYDKLWNITSGSYVAAPGCDEDWVPEAEVELSVPEGQWLYIGGQTFKNRESGNTIKLAGLRSIKGETGVYVSGDAKAGAAQWETNLKAFCNSEKLYGAHNSNSLVQADAAYNYVENDIFVIMDADNYMYRPVAAMDTIKIFRDKDNYYTLYEQGKLLEVNDEVKEGFLGLEHFLDPKFAEKNAALLVGTAAGYGTWRPEYMLAVDAEVVADGWTCPFNQEHNSQAWREEHGGHCADAVKDRPYVYGRYLVNLVDSVNLAHRKDCYYQDLDNTIYYRLGFVQATHIGDSLIIASTNDTINLNDNTLDKVCTFAFRYTDAERRQKTSLPGSPAGASLVVGILS